MIQFLTPLLVLNNGFDPGVKSLMIITTVEQFFEPKNVQFVRKFFAE